MGFYCAPDWGVEYCSDRGRLFVCVFVCEQSSEIHVRSFLKFLLCVTYMAWYTLAALRYVMYVWFYG